LILSVLETVHSISLDIDSVSEFLNFQLHAIVLYQCLFLALQDLVEVTNGHFILELQLLNLTSERAPLVLNLLDCSLDVAALVLELLVRDGELLQGLLLAVEFLLDLEDLLL